MDNKYVKEAASTLNLSETQLDYFKFVCNKIKKESYTEGYEDGYADGLNNNQQ